MDITFTLLSAIIYVVGSILLGASIFYLLIVWNVKKPEYQDEYYPYVSVMAYAWQSGNVIERKINNFLGQNYPRDRFEVIIYDNDSTDETKDICLKYERLGLIRYYRSPIPYDRKAPVLDQAIGEVAHGEVIALTDPDGVCEKDWLRKIVQPFRDSTVGAVAGLTHCGNYYRNIFTRLRAIEDEWWYNISVLGRSGKIRISDFQPICGANYALRRKAWESVGRTHGSSLVEDYEMTFKLYNKGWRMVCADANVWQEEVETISDYLKQRRRWYQSPLKEVLKGRGKMNKFLGGLPISMQATAFLSFIYSIMVWIYHATIDRLTFFNIIFITPFILICLALTFGLLKVGRKTLIPYIPLFLTFDTSLQMIVFLDTKIRLREERHWVKLGSGQYYHAGTEIRMV
jgi:cellulose synthase/poly-beta-1,6-N-acetylglucosamine synthase-like glycosyltransferase